MAGWLSAVVLSLVLVRVVGADGDVQRTLVALGLASSAGMTVAGGGPVGGRGPAPGRCRRRPAEPLRSSLPVVGAFLLVAVVALLAGRLVTDAVLEPGIAGALVAGVVGSVLAGGLVAGRAGAGGPRGPARAASARGREPAKEGR